MSGRCVHTGADGSPGPDTSHADRMQPPHKCFPARFKSGDKNHWDSLTMAWSGTPLTPRKAHQTLLILGRCQLSSNAQSRVWARLNSSLCSDTEKTHVLSPGATQRFQGYGCPPTLLGPLSHITGTLASLFLEEEGPKLNNAAVGLLQGDAHGSSPSTHAHIHTCRAA